VIDLHIAKLHYVRRQIATGFELAMDGDVEAVSLFVDVRGREVRLEGTAGAGTESCAYSGILALR